VKDFERLSDGNVNEKENTNRSVRVIERCSQVFPLRRSLLHLV